MRPRPSSSPPPSSYSAASRIRWEESAKQKKKNDPDVRCGITDGLDRRRALFPRPLESHGKQARERSSIVRFSPPQLILCGKIWEGEKPLEKDERTVASGDIEEAITLK